MKGIAERQGVLGGVSTMTHPAQETVVKEFQRVLAMLAPAVVEKRLF